MNKHYQREVILISRQTKVLLKSLVNFIFFFLHQNILEHKSEYIMAAILMCTNHMSLGGEIGITSEKLLLSGASGV